MPNDIPQNSLIRVPYDNYQIFHPDGTLMCFCSKKKANWYLRNNLATIHDDNKVILNFIPKGYGDPEEILIGRKNCCVITGDTDNLTKHHVVPSQYRQHFDVSYKDKNSCDIVVLCRDKHDKYEETANDFKIQLHNDYVDNSFLEMNKAWIEAKSIFNCINNYYNKLPHDKQIYMTCRLEGLLAEWKFTEDELKNSSYLGGHVRNKVIVNSIGIVNLIILWKLHFMKYGKPNFLPAWWKPNIVKVVNKNIDNKKTDLLEIDMSQPELLALIKKYDLYGTASLYL